MVDGIGRSEPWCRPGAGERTLGVLTALLMLTGLAGCGFLRLEGEIRNLDSNYLLSGMIANAVDYEGVVIRVFVVERDDEGRVVSADLGNAGEHGAFAFVVDSSEGQYIMAHADIDGDEKYAEGEPAWVHTDGGAHPAPVPFIEETRRARVVGRLSTKTVIPDEIIREARKFAAGRPLQDIVRGWNIPVQVGEIADLDEDRFSAKRGQQGLWQPASFPIEAGVGIFFLERYDPDRIPVLFVHGAGGSPQNWRAIFAGLDRDRFQPWFYLYATGRRLDEMAEWLNGGVAYLQDFYRFEEMAVVAHSMGGLVSRAFINKNLSKKGKRYIDVFVTISTPWAGHEAAKAGVERSPAVVPAWYDLATGSEFLEALFADPSPHFPPHHLLFSYRGKSSMVLPSSNDGTVSVASQLRDEAQNGAVRVRGYDASHMAVLSESAVITDLNRVLHNAFSER